jgi:hypothetical protein
MSTTPSRNLEQMLIDRNGALTAALVRIRALAAERRTDRDFAFIFQMAEDTMATAGAPAGTTTIGVDFRRWYELWAANFPTDEEGKAAADERQALEDRIISTRAGGGGDILVKARMLREHAKDLWGRTDEVLASIAADLEHLATGGAS